MIRALTNDWRLTVLYCIGQIEGVLEGEKVSAKEALAKGNKQRAITALRRRKYQETLLTQTDKQLATLQDLVRFILCF